MADDEILIPESVRAFLPEGIRIIRELGERPVVGGLSETAPPPTAGQKALILLQENTGGGGIQYLPDWTPDWLNNAVTAIIDRLAETFENIKTQLQAAGRYDVVHMLTDQACTRARLLDCLVEEARKGRTVDLIVLGHGSAETLVLYQENLTGAGIRSLRTDAQARGVNDLPLRTVFMCNCYGSTLGDDWLSIGARAAVGARQNNYMPEPMITYFVHDYLAGKTVGNCARDAYTATIPWYLPIYPPTPHITYTTVQVPYPCPTWTDPLRICYQAVDVPTGVTFTPHSNVLESELLVIGDGSVTF